MGQAFTRLGNSLVTVVGEFDRASGASEGLARAIGDLGDGLDRFDTEGFVTEVQRIVDIIREAEEAGTNWLNNIGNFDFFARLNEILGINEDGLTLNPDVREAENKIATLERLIEGLETQIESDKRFDINTDAAVAQLQRVREELAALRAEAANIPRYSFGNNTDTGTFFNTADYVPPPSAPSAEPVSIEDHPATGGGNKGGGKGKRGGASREKLDDFEREAKSIRERTALMQLQSQVYGTLTGSTKEYGDAAQYAETKAKLLAAAQQAGKEVTPQLEAQIDRLAQSYAEAGKQAEDAARKLEEINDNAKRGAGALSAMSNLIFMGRHIDMAAWLHVRQPPRWPVYAASQLTPG